VPSKEEQPQQNQSQQLCHKDPGNFGPKVAPPFLDLIPCVYVIAAGSSAASIVAGTSKFKSKITLILIPWQAHQRDTTVHALRCADALSGA
jgi:hypothetical protein